MERKVQTLPTPEAAGQPAWLDQRLAAYLAGPGKDLAALTTSCALLACGVPLDQHTAGHGKLVAAAMHMAGRTRQFVREPCGAMVTSWVLSKAAQLPAHAVQTPAPADTQRMFERWEFTCPHSFKGSATAWVGGPPPDRDAYRGRIELIVEQGGFELRLSPTKNEARALAALLLKAVGDAS